jgi:quercetin dioxygenase-like cupin family protein
MSNEHTHNYYWFLNTLVCVKVSCNENKDAISLLEHTAPTNDSPPMHIHLNEDEIFYVLEGNIRYRINEEDHELIAGQSILVPKGVPHTYLVESSPRARWLTVTNHKDFELFVMKMSRKADHIELPPLAGAPTPEQIEHLNNTALKFGIKIVGPPLH